MTISDILSDKENVQNFINIVKKRSQENIKSFQLLYDNQLYGNCISILRQELDSYVRIIYLNILNESFKNELINQTLRGRRWRNFGQIITDAGMLKSIETKTIGWEKMVYQIGCSFIHLSHFHNYATENPFSTLSKDDVGSIVDFIAEYHNIYIKELNVQNIIPALPLVMKKISDNLQCELDSLNN